MHFKLLLVFVEDGKTDEVMKAARVAGATGATIINNARGEGITQTKTFFRLNLETKLGGLLLIVEEHLSRAILENIAEVEGIVEMPGKGIAIQIEIEDAVVDTQKIQQLNSTVE